MRNLKKVLALAVASVMLMGMMVMGTSAAGYPDVAGNDNQEAIEVLKLVGVMSGDDKGNFNPEKNVTRNEMAVIMVNLMDLKLNGSHPFTDVPTWADKYVAACYTNGVVSGTSATTYGGDEQLTAVQAALMVMKTLGYFEFQGEFGSDWKLATVKQATKLDLFKDIEAGVDEKLTRAEAAQLVFNALFCKTVIVTEEGGMQVEGNGISVSQAAKYDYEEGKVLAEKLYGKTGANLNLRQVADGTDDLGRITTKWTYKDSKGKTTTAEFAAEADYTFVATKAKAHTTKNGVLTTLKDYTGNDDLTLAAAAGTVVLNGTPAVSASSVVLAVGDVVEVYTNDDAVTKVIVKSYGITKITDVDTDVTEADAKDDVTAYVTVDALDVTEDKNTKIAGYNAATYVKDAYLAYISDGTEIIDSYVITDVVKGVSFTAIANDDVTAKVGTTTYTSAGAAKFGSPAAVGADNSYDLYLDANGYVLMVDPVVTGNTLDDVYYVVGEYTIDAADNEYGEAGSDKYYVQVVDMNGVISNVQVDTLSVVNAGDIVTFSTYKVNGKVQDDKQITIYGDTAAINDDYTVEVVGSTVELKTTTKRLGSAYLKNYTKYIIVDTDTSLKDTEATVKTGGVAYTGVNATVITAKDGTTTVAQYVLFTEATASTTEYEDKLYVKAADYNKYQETEDGEIFTVYNAKGETVEILVADGTGSLTAGFNTYEIDEDGIYTLTPAGDTALPGSGTEWTDTWTGTTLGRYFYSFYDGLLSIGSGGKLLDIPAADAVIVDLHDTDAQYSKTLTSLAQIETLLNGDNAKLARVIMDLDIGEDGVVTIFITDAIKA